MNEAVALGKSYDVIQNFAEDVESRTQLRSQYDVATVIHMSGGFVRKISLDDWNNNIYPFVEITGGQNYTITVCAQFPEDLQRVLLVQGLGHYFLHGDAGDRPCVISSSTRHPASREGLWFSLAFLMPDRAFIDLKKTMDNEMLARFFRVPINMIEIKNKTLQSANPLLQNDLSLT